MESPDLVLVASASVQVPADLVDSQQSPQSSSATNPVASTVATDEDNTAGTSGSDLPPQRLVPDADSESGVVFPASSDDARGTSWADVATDRVDDASRPRSPAASAGQGWTAVGRKGKAQCSGGQRRRVVPAKSGLRGAQRVWCLPYYLSGISPDSTVDDIIDYCRRKSVTVTGVYLLRSKAWGTVSAKAFINKLDGEKVLSDGFWPPFMKCRLWRKEPPVSGTSLPELA